ncbi:L-asparaginase [Clostridiaceae bacterium JG1575]|nr:L-asparaginase [Clostridiaceae bacterium JG1575]
MKKVAVIFNGGTISMKVDPKLKAAVPTLTGEEIMSFVTGIEEYAQVESIAFSSFPSPHMTPPIMMALAQKIREVLMGDVDGVVVTHGTDTLEETAYFVDLTVDTQKPIVFTGSMRSGSELGYDGPSNLAAAICTAASSSARGRGVLVCLNGELNTASEVTKANSMALNAFRTPTFGQVGMVDNNQVLFYRETERHQCQCIEKLEDRVALLKTCTGMDGSLVDFCLERGDRGIVLEAMGRGNIPPAMVPSVQRAIGRGVPVVIVSRCFEGRVYDSYGYPGGGRNLREIGVILGDNLNGQKARIKLMVALSATKDLAAVRRWFEEDLYNER